jgi:hypothetical protein
LQALLRPLTLDGPGQDIGNRPQETLFIEGLLVALPDVEVQ